MRGLAALANPAAAFQVIWNDAANRSNADVEIWHGGSSLGPENRVRTAVRHTFCASDIDDYRGVDGSFWAIACVTKTAIGPHPIGSKLLWNKRSKGGSAVGVGPVALGTSIGFMKPSTNDPGSGINCRHAPPPVGIDPPEPHTRHIWLCDTPEKAKPKTITSQVPNFGTSDIEPDKFASNFPENVPSSDFDLDGTPGPALPPYDTKNLKPVPVAYLVFGVPANLLMYQDLQRAQFPVSSECHPSNAAYGDIKTKTANANLEKCMPSLTGQEIRSIFAQGGAIRAAADFQMESPPGSGTYVAMTATGTTDNTIQIVRRVKGSGTQAQFNAIMLGYPCDATFDGSIDSLVPEGEDGGFNDFVSENESSGGVEKALSDYSRGTNTSGKNPSLLKRWAIGLQSLENNADLSADYRFLKVDGFAPTLVNVHAGDYHAFAAASIQYKAGAPIFVVDALTRLAAHLADARNLPRFNPNHPFGKSGWLGAPSNTFPNTLSAELDFTRPVNWFQRVSSSGKNNTCALPSAFPKNGGTDITVAPQNCSANGSGDQNCYTP